MFEFLKKSQPTLIVQWSFIQLQKNTNELF